MQSLAYPSTEAPVRSSVITENESQGIWSLASGQGGGQSSVGLCWRLYLTQSRAGGANMGRREMPDCLGMGPGLWDLRTHILTIDP